MSFHPVDSYIFHPVDGEEGVFERRSFGLESLTCCMLEQLDGFTHLTTSAAVELPGNPSPSDLEPAVHEAWVFLRQALPSIATKSIQYPDEGYALRYEVPKSADDVKAWIKDTVFFGEKAGSLYASHVKLRDNRYWAPSAARHVVELHVVPLEKGFSFNLVIEHNAIDGRTALIVLEYLLETLTAVLEKQTGPSSDIQWGAEVGRLPPPGPFVQSINETGQPPALVAPEPAPAPPPGAMIPWLFPPAQRDVKGDVTRLVTMTPEATSKLHALTKEKGTTVTQVITALSALAHVEAYAKIALEMGDERFSTVAGAYAMATHYLVAINFINHRHKLTGYDNIHSPKGMPLIAIDGSPVLAGFDAIKKLVRIDPEAKTVTREQDEEAFWALTSEIAGGFKSVDTSLEGWLGRELEKESTTKGFQPGNFLVPALIMSSLGDMGRLGMFTKFKPSEENKGLVVRDIVSGIRIRNSVLFNLLWEYNGALTLHFHAAGEYNNVSDVKAVTDTLGELFDSLLQVKNSTSSVCNLDC